MTNPFSNTPIPWGEGSTKTEVILTFYTWPENGFSGTTDSSEGRALIGNPIRVNTSKAFGAASGSITIVMKKPERLSSFQYETLWSDPEGVWVLVQWRIDGRVIDSTLGMLDSIDSTRTRSGHGTRSETYTIHARDFGKVFEETQLYLNPYLKGALSAFTRIIQVTKDAIINGTPADYTKALITAWIGGATTTVPQTWAIPPGLGLAPSLFNMLDLSGIETMTPLANGAATDLRFLSPDLDGGSLWDVMQQFSNGVLNELWVDLAPSKLDPLGLTGLKPTVFLRERKFPTKLDGGSLYATLPTWDLTPNLVGPRQVAKGGAATRYNFWILVPQGFGSVNLESYVQQTPGVAGTPGANPIWNEQSIRRYGLRRWEQTTPFVPSTLGIKASDVTSDNFLRTVTAQWLTKVHDWYSIAPKQLSGTISMTRIAPQIRIGHRVIEKTSSGDIVFYVEGVDHVWQHPGTGQTILTVTRGEYTTASLLNAEYAGFDAQQIKARAVLAATEQTVALNKVF